MCDEEDLTNKVGEVFSKLDKKPFFTVPRRIGTVRDNTPRPVKVSFPSANVVGDVLSPEDFVLSSFSSGR